MEGISNSVTWRFYLSWKVSEQMFEYVFMYFCLKNMLVCYSV